MNQWLNVLYRFVAFVMKSQPMQDEKQDIKTIEEATQKVRERMTLEKMRSTPKYKDITEEEYEKLIKDAETFALLVLRVFTGQGKDCEH